MFSLGHREKENDARGEMISGGESAAGTYKTLAMEKFFKGMQQRCMNSEIFDGTYQMTPENLEKAKKWLDKDLEKCLNKLQPFVSMQYILICITNQADQKIND